MTATSVATVDTEPASVVGDLSAWIIAGCVTSESVRNGLRDAVEAERLGFRSVYMSERYNLKEAGTVLGGVGALTSRIGIATGVIAARSRHPLMTAALGASMQACYGPRFVIGMGRSEEQWFANEKRASNSEILDHMRICKQLWNGETVSYDGPAGHFDNLRLGDLYDGPSPATYLGCAGMPLGARTAADPAVDGVLLFPMVTPEATHKAVTNIRNACERIGRDPDTLRICQPVVTAPELSDQETRELVHARFITYITYPGTGPVMMELSGWDKSVADKIAQHPVFQKMADKTADQSFHRDELLEPASLIPDTWMTDCSAIGSIDTCVAKLQEFKDAGADEIATYGSSPTQNAALIDAWRKRSAQPV